MRLIPIDNSGKIYLFSKLSHEDICEEWLQSVVSPGPVITSVPPVLVRRFSGPLNQEPLPVRLSCEFGDKED